MKKIMASLALAFAVFVPLSAGDLSAYNEDEGKRVSASAKEYLFFVSAKGKMAAPSLRAPPEPGNKGAPQKKMPVHAGGSGVLVKTTDGLGIVTNNHVVDMEPGMKVVLTLDRAGTTREHEVTLTEFVLPPSRRSPGEE